MAARAISGPHVRHEDAQHSVAFTQERLNRSLQTVADISGRRIIIERTGMAVMDHYQKAIRAFRNKMVGQPLQTGPQVEPKFLHASELTQVLHRTGHVGDYDTRQELSRKAFSAPNIFDQRPASLIRLPGRLNRD